MTHRLHEISFMAERASDLRNAAARRAARIALVALVALAASLLSGTALAGGRCVRATLEQAMVLPDGTTHGPGTIRICLERAHSPVAGLHDISIDGRTVGVFSGQRSESAEFAGYGDAVLVFRPTDEGSLALLAYAIGDGKQERMVTHRLEGTRTATGARSAGLATSGPERPFGSDGTLVLVRDRG